MQIRKISVNLWRNSRPKTERPVLDRPLKVGGGIQPRLVTVLTPATTFTVAEDCSQKGRAVNRGPRVIYNFYKCVAAVYLESGVVPIHLFTTKPSLVIRR
jgi:hypothetical protein